MGAQALSDQLNKEAVLTQAVWAAEPGTAACPFQLNGKICSQRDSCLYGQASVPG